VQSALASKKLREDLYYRLNAFTLQIPPLRERKEEVPLLLKHFMTRVAERYGRPPLPFSPSLLDSCLNHNWPGNVRELENSVERACALSSGPLIQVTDLPSSLSGNGQHTPVNGDGSAKIVPISELEKRTILNTITQLNGDKLLAARLLGIGKTTLYRKLKEYGAEV